MALQINYYYEPIQATLYNVYWKINSENGIIGGKDVIHYNIEAFKSMEESKNENAKVITRFNFKFVPNMSENAPNFIAQSYNHAKTLPMFNGSVDV